MGERLTAIRSIRAYCMDCSNNSPKEVELCTMPHCPLYPYRFGKNPNIAKGTRGAMSEERKEAVRQRFAEARQKKTQGVE